MADSVVFFEKTMNITSFVYLNRSFFCCCGWVGVSTELANSQGFSCCPKCNDFDVRLDLSDLDH